MYGFKDPSGEYYGDEGLPLGATRASRLRTIVLYRTGKPHLNKIAMCCLFHRLVILGTGVTDLDEATVAAKVAEREFLTATGAATRLAEPIRSLPTQWNWSERARH